MLLLSSFVRDLSAIEAAEVSEEELIFKLAPLAEMTLVGTEPGLIFKI